MAEPGRIPPQVSPVVRVMSYFLIVWTDPSLYGLLPPGRGGTPQTFG